MNVHIGIGSLETDMLTRERQAAIAGRLARDGKVLAGELAAAFDVSEDTIRRDLRDMASAGLCERVYGGALARSSAPLPPPLHERARIGAPQKHALAAAAAAFLADGSTIFIDAGSANLALAAKLPQDRRLRVVTHSPAIALAVPPRPRHPVTLIGGRYDAETGACLGADALGEVERLRPDLLVLGACGLDAAAGVTAFDPEDAAIKRRLVGASVRTMVLATAEKLATVAPFFVTGVEAVGRIVTEAGAPAPVVEALRETGADVVLAGAPGR
ncbi:DeoR/GlpR family DNA-binding transcription regulator [Jiella avicenniae]|uniref:DeoR/GlpR family DNA-binding transcription regulator n=1 Tax=Jiella avicenniae TaxID=2907202 RepID=A0A9X1T5F5_9HYPH|nr:DeoR/GlpR family DNA-binding transcription regulator [Jiella avicenniae]MCE7028839.1 DeoR/GlpR family DNA-binding transcription regulator [Jiella avicenniae]